MHHLWWWFKRVHFCPNPYWWLSITQYHTWHFLCITCGDGSDQTRSLLSQSIHWYFLCITQYHNWYFLCILNIIIDIFCASPVVMVQTCPLLSQSILVVEHHSVSHLTFFMHYLWWWFRPDAFTSVPIHTLIFFVHHSIS